MNIQELKELLVKEQDEGMYLGIEASDTHKLTIILLALLPAVDGPYKFHGKFSKTSGPPKIIEINTNIGSRVVLLNYIYCKKGKFLSADIINRFNLNSFYIWRPEFNSSPNCAWEEINDLDTQLITRTIQL